MVLKQLSLPLSHQSTQASSRLILFEPPTQETAVKLSLDRTALNHGIHLRRRTSPANIRQTTMAYATLFMSRIPPSQQEREYYYYGITPRPRLVARSSTDIWNPVQDGRQLEKQSRPAGDHPMVHAWNNFTNPMRREIFQALNSVIWSVIDIMRVGYKGINSQTGEEFDQPVTFLVTVQNGSVHWARGVSVITECHQILRRHGILDVECEMKETRY